MPLGQGVDQQALVGVLQAAGHPLGDLQLGEDLIEPLHVFAQGVAHRVLGVAPDVAGRLHPLSPQLLGVLPGLALAVVTRHLVVLGVLAQLLVELFLGRIQGLPLIQQPLALLVQGMKL